jgi:hypothetical protein
VDHFQTNKKLWFHFSQMNWFFATLNLNILNPGLFIFGCNISIKGTGHVKSVSDKHDDPYYEPLNASIQPF